MTMKHEDIARVAHEANRAYCLSLGDATQLPWDTAPDWAKTSAVNGVKFTAEHMDGTPEMSHINWLSEKLAAGWKFGPVKRPEVKEHPCCLPYADLPADQRTKDALFQAVVKTLLKVS